VLLGAKKRDPKASLARHDYGALKPDSPGWGMNTVIGVQRRWRFFFVVMAAAVIAAVFAGFEPTFYFRGFHSQTRPMSVLLHVHGIVFSVWVALFLAQTVLIARGNYRWHRRLGWILVGVAAAMIVLVILAMVEELRRVNGFPPPPLAIALSVFDILVFGILVGSALYLRRLPDWHKRLMLFATIVLLGAPMFRVVTHRFEIHSGTTAGVVSTLMVDAFFIPCLAYDLITRRAVHPAYLLGIGLIVADQLAQIAVVDWAPWINFATAMQRLVS
jgi:hypothetical protein